MASIQGHFFSNDSLAAIKPINGVQTLEQQVLSIGINILDRNILDIVLF